MKMAAQKTRTPQQTVASSPSRGRSASATCMASSRAKPPRCLPPRTPHPSSPPPVLRRLWLLWAHSVLLPCHRLAQEPPWAMPGLWGHSAQTTACFRVTSVVPVGVGQPGKGLRKPTWKIFQTKECDSLQGTERKGKKKKIPPVVLLGSKFLRHCLGCI